MRYTFTIPALLLLVSPLLSGCEQNPTAASKDTSKTSASSASTTTAAAKNHFGAAFKLTKGEPLRAAIARAAKAASPAASGSASTAASAGTDSACADDAPIDSCEGANNNEQGEKVRVSGIVESVCQKAGCWMVLKDGDVKARIFTKQDNFFLPKNIAGKKAEAEGTLRARTITKKFAKHLEEDRGGDPSKITSGSSEYLMTATAVALK